MIIWRGRGILVAVIVGSCLLLSDLFTRVWFHDNGYYAENGWPKLTGFWFAAVIVWLLLHPWKSKTTIGYDDAKAVLRSQDQLFFVSARHWPFLLGALGIGFYFVRD